jgi:hypothetical protein
MMRAASFDIAGTAEPQPAYGLIPSGNSVAPDYLDDAAALFGISCDLVLDLAGVKGLQ